jgi:hypothetical protein
MISLESFLPRKVANGLMGELLAQVGGNNLTWYSFLSRKVANVFKGELIALVEQITFRESFFPGRWLIFLVRGLLAQAGGKLSYMRDSSQDRLQMVDLKWELLAQTGGKWSVSRESFLPR